MSRILSALLGFALGLGLAGGVALLFNAAALSHSPASGGGTRVHGLSTLYYGDLPDRLNAAKEFGADPAAGPWITTFLLTRLTVSEGLAGESRETARFDVSVAVALIESLPENSDLSVMMAISMFVRDCRTGPTSTRKEWIMNTSRSDGESKRLCDVVLDKLRARMKTDHGDDVAAWQDAIVEAY